MNRPAWCQECGEPTGRWDASAGFAGAWICESCSCDGAPTLQPGAPAIETLHRGEDLYGQSLYGERAGPAAASLWDPTRDRTRARCAVLGIYDGGPCVLPDHDDHAAHVVEAGEHPVYDCPLLDEPLSLAQVHAVVAYADVPYADRREANRAPELRRVRPPAAEAPETSRWLEDLDYRAGLLVPGSPRLVFVSGLSGGAQLAYERIDLLLRLRDAGSSRRWRDRDLFTYARRFARAHMPASNDVARAAVDELRARRVMIATGSKAGGPFGGPLIYRVGRADEVQAR